MPKKPWLKAQLSQACFAFWENPDSDTSIKEASAAAIETGVAPMPEIISYLTIFIWLIQVCFSCRLNTPSPVNASRLPQLSEIHGWNKSNKLTIWSNRQVFYSKILLSVLTRGAINVQAWIRCPSNGKHGVVDQSCRIHFTKFFRSAAVAPVLNAIIMENQWFSYQQYFVHHIVPLIGNANLEDQTSEGNDDHFYWFTSSPWYFQLCCLIGENQMTIEYQSLFVWMNNSYCIGVNSKENGDECNDHDCSL